MKLPLIFTFSLCTLFITPSTFAIQTSCNKSQKQINTTNSTFITINFIYGPIKSISITSKFPENGRLKAFKGETQFDECGFITKYSFSTQEYIHENIETNLLRMPTSDNIKQIYQLKNRHRTHTLYLSEFYNKNKQNQLTGKTSFFYDNDGSLMGTDISQFSYQDNKITLSTIIDSNSNNKGNVIHYYYDKQGRLLKTTNKNNDVMSEFRYGEDGKILQHVQIYTSLYDDIREYDKTCKEWDEYNNCVIWDMVSTIKQRGKLIDTSTATVYYKLEYYE
ncbi:hypothetical protein AB6H17_19050 [Proteus vulgaris]|uniref:hypothetical protein n=1 Tax=Proteus vulgaris TaxID=585 RepID=UPI0034DD5749